ncbi:hypothetical protein C5167_005931 [Papaver somniferum]|uniref:Uncharacterized protein n=1 Tax=Papaver somniferum TaxID=3469 RepID=A0A4Y7JG65_PAPSO|nr:hypothetical protein C5167_005931 [Papaver somniferum]
MSVSQKWRITQLFKYPGLDVELPRVVHATQQNDVTVCWIET